MAMLSEVALSAVRDAQRYDAEYWEPAYLENEDRLDSLKCIRLSDAASSVRSGPFGSNLLCENYVPGGVAVIRPFNIKSLTISRDNIAYVPQDVCDASRLKYYAEGDLMIARVGDVRAGILRKCNSKVTISPNVIAVKLKASILNPAYVAAFLNTWPGRAQMLRGVKAVAQPTITTELVNSIRIPLLPDGFQSDIGDKVEASFLHDDASLQIYAEAESLLESTLGLNKLDLEPRLFYEADYKDVAEAGRFAAEYYQPAKREILRSLARMQGQTIGEQYQSIRSLWQPEKANPQREVRNYDLTDALSPFLDETTAPVYPTEIKSTKKRLRPGDIVVSRLRSYLKEIAVIFVVQLCFPSEVRSEPKPRLVTLLSLIASPLMVLPFRQVAEQSGPNRWIRGGSPNSFSGPVGYLFHQLEGSAFRRHASPLLSCVLQTLGKLPSHPV